MNSNPGGRVEKTVGGAIGKVRRAENLEFGGYWRTCFEGKRSPAHSTSSTLLQEYHRSTAPSPGPTIVSTANPCQQVRHFAFLNNSPLKRQLERVETLKNQRKGDRQRVHSTFQDIQRDVGDADANH